MPSGTRKAKAMVVSPLETDGEKRSGRKTNTFPNLQNTLTEKEILQSLSNDIVKVRNKKDILTFIRPKLRLLFNTDDIFICFLDALNETLNPVLRIGGPNRSKLPDYDRIVNTNYPIHDGFIDKILDSNEPIVVDILKLADANDCIKFFRTTGLVQSLSIRLNNAGKVIGIMTLWSETSNFFTARYKHLISEIANQISLIVVNILANEEIAKREEEKSVLLSLSYKIAVVRNKNELLDLLNINLKELFPIKGFGITLLNENGETHSPFVVDVQDAIRNDVEFQNVTTQLYSVNDGVFNNIINAGEPVNLYVDELAAMPEAPAYVYFWEKMEIKEVIGTPIRIGETNLGCFILLRDHQSTNNINNSLLKGVCGQISVAISNILANEEIANREKEKSLLLSISHEIAALRSRSDLLNIVNTKLKPLFSIKECGIAQINEDGTTYSAFALDLGDNIKNHVEFKRITSGKYNVNDKIFSSIINSDEPVLFDVGACASEPGMPDFVSFCKLVGLQNVIGIAMRAGGKNIGCAFLHLGNNGSIQKRNLLRSICAQLAVAVSNILANEKVLDQLNEINRYKQQLEQEKTYLKEEIEHSHNYSEIIGESAEIKKVFTMVTQVAYSDSTVLILGETGTGKELIARAIHNSSTRKNKLMVKVNCAALPANLIESELFGHERGSFTGAIERRIGKFELANNGTLFLDEIGEMPPDLQVKLLRALQEKEIERVGGKTTIKTDVRIIAATNRNLEKLMDEGKFRRDLYYRLNIFPITLPSLRDRREDIPPLVSYFIVRYSKKAGKKINTISNKTLQELIQYDWPGNIRELEHLIERSVLLTTGDTIKEIHLPQQQKRILAGVPDKENITIRTIDENEKQYILKVLKHVNGRIGGVGGAAELLGVPTSTLNSKIRRLGIRKEHI